MGSPIFLGSLAMMPSGLEAGLAIDLEGTDSLLGGFADFSLPERGRAATLLLTLDAGLTLIDKRSRE